MDLLVNFSFTLSTPSSLESNHSLGAEDLRPSPPLLSVFSMLVLTLLGLLVAATFAWNLLVLATILRVRTFHRVPHNLVASMAVSDVLVAALVMPLSLVHELSGRRWQLGRRLCQLWVACDVLCCTASIWNVTAIALDRYWSIACHLEYTTRARKRASNVMIALTWALSAVISLAPLLFGWGETYSEHREECQVSREPSYAVFSTVGAFYLPLCVVLFVYWKIYKAAKLRVGARKTNSVSPVPEAMEVGAQQSLTIPHSHLCRLYPGRYPSLTLVESGTFGFREGQAGEKPRARICSDKLHIPELPILLASLIGDFLSYKMRSLSCLFYLVSLGTKTLWDCDNL